MKKIEETKITVSESDLWMMVLSTIRYSMGRRSYIVGYCCDDLLKNYCKHLAVHQVVQIADEIEKELQHCEARKDTLGMEMDHRAWKQAVLWLREHAKERGVKINS